jgi:hypothetical protein
MKTVSRFETKDGRLFTDEAAALKYEAELAAVESALSELMPPTIAKDMKFRNGGGYVQLTKERVARFLAAYRNVVVQSIRHGRIDSANAERASLAGFWMTTTRRL